MDIMPQQPAVFNPKIYKKAIKNAEKHRAVKRAVLLRLYG